MILTHRPATTSVHDAVIIRAGSASDALELGSRRRDRPAVCNKTDEDDALLVIRHTGSPERSDQSLQWRWRMFLLGLSARLHEADRVLLLAAVVAALLPGGVQGRI